MSSFLSRPREAAPAAEAAPAPLLSFFQEEEKKLECEEEEGGVGDDRPRDDLGGCRGEEGVTGGDTPLVALRFLPRPLWWS